MAPDFTVWTPMSKTSALLASPPLLMIWLTPAEAAPPAYATVKVTMLCPLPDNKEENNDLRMLNSFATTQHRQPAPSRPAHPCTGPWVPRAPDGAASAAHGGYIATPPGITLFWRGGQRGIICHPRDSSTCASHGPPAPPRAHAAASGPLNLHFDHAVHVLSQRSEPGKRDNVTIPPALYTPYTPVHIRVYSRMQTQHPETISFFCTKIPTVQVYTCMHGCIGSMAVPKKTKIPLLPSRRAFRSFYIP